MFNIEEIGKVIRGKIIYNNNNNNKIIDNVSIDSRNINSNTLFIPIIGAKYDGNNFIGDCIKKGINATLISSNYKYKNKTIKKCIKNKISVIEVGDTINSLHLLASYNRDKNKDTIIIAITGSNGKTTSKEIIYQVLKNDYKVLKTEKNYNNHIGVPLTLLKLNKHDICILEMGMNHFNEISLLSKISKPDIGIITNIGSAHIGNLGSKNNILKAKLEIIDGFNDKSILLLNKNDKLLRALKFKNINVKYYSTRYKKVGDYEGINRDLAIAICKIFNVKKYNKYIKEFKYPSMRNEIIKLNDKIIINDCYNANYESMYSGILNTLNKYKKRHILLFLGEIREIGEYSKYYHSLIGKLINKSNIDILYLIGNDTKYINEEINNKKIIIKNYINYNINDLYNDLYKYNNSVVYFKGSRANNIDIIVNELINKINRS